MVKLILRVEENKKINKLPEINEIMTGVGSVNFSDWEKLDLRVAQIKKVEDISGQINTILSSCLFFVFVFIPPP